MLKKGNLCTSSANTLDGTLHIGTALLKVVLSHPKIVEQRLRIAMERFACLQHGSNCEPKLDCTRARGLLRVHANSFHIARGTQCERNVA